MIHENVCESRKVNSISFEAEALWFRILTRVDDNGNYYRDARRVFPAIMLEKRGCTEELVEKWLRELIRIGLVAEFEADEREYLHVVDFEKYQDLRQDGFASIKYPIHPSNLGPGYTKEGRRSLVLRNGEELKKAVRERCESGPTPVIDECHAIEVEVEVKGKEEVEGEVSDDETFEPVEPNFYTFQRAFKQAAGIKPKDFVGSVERYKVLGRKYGEQEVLDSINTWVEQKGGKAVTRRSIWSPKNFLEEAEDILDARIEAKNEPPEGEEISRMAKAGRPPAVQM